MNNFFLNSLKLVWENSRNQLVWIILIRIYQGFFPLFLVILTQQLINSIQLIISNEGQSLKQVFFIISIQILLLILNSFVGKLEYITELKIQQNIEYVIKKTIAEKIVVIEYSNFDDHEFYNLLQRVEGDVGSRFLTPIYSILSVGKNIISLISLIIFLFQVHWSLLLLLGLTVIPNLIVQTKIGKQSYALFRYQTPNAREHQYIFSLLKDRGSNKEIRIFQTGNYLIQKWSNFILRNNLEVLNLAKKQQNNNLFMEILNNLVYGGSILLLLWCVANKLIKIGGFVAVLDSLKRTQISMNEIILLIATFYNDSLFVKDYFHLMNYSEDKFSGVNFPNKLQTGIKVENLSFAYPFSNKKILRDISFEVSPGETIAIVGDNGSGKSTLVKCLTGIYKPEGSIKFDGIEVSEINKKSLFDNLSVTFQDFVRYEFTLSENVYLGEDFELEKLKEALSQVGANKFINELNNGYKTRLGRLFEHSTDLSGGQWQRLSLARSLIRNSKILILDEPTSSLDPVTEAELFQKFKNIIKDRTSIFTSHRMYSCQFADKIIVMKKGRIVEVGSHLELLSLKSEYYRLYTLQSNMYESTDMSKSEVS